MFEPKRFFKAMAMMLSVILIVGTSPLALLAEEGECAHIHDSDCGYIQGASCNHAHDEACGGLPPTSDTINIANFDDLPEEMLYQGYNAGVVAEPLAAYTASDWDSLQAAMTNAKSGPDASYTITITEAITVPAGKHVLDGGTKNITLMRGVYGDLLTVGANAELTMSNITISGNKSVFTEGDFENRNSLVSVIAGGEFIMNSGELTDNCAPFGAGVYVYDATFTMNGGKISGNQSANGAGVYIEGATFILDGGEISGNSGSGVEALVSDIIMYDGKISKNGGLGTGGGVDARYNTNFTMYGGEITENTSDSFGGGVCMINDPLRFNGIFKMSGGVISGNTAPEGSGVYYINYSLCVSGMAVIGTATDGNAITRSSASQYILIGDGDVGLSPGAHINISSHADDKVGDKIAQRHFGLVDANDLAALNYLGEFSLVSDGHFVLLDSAIPQVSISRVTGNKGKSVKVQVTIPKNPGIAAAVLTFSIPEGLTLVSMEAPNNEITISNTPGSPKVSLMHNHGSNPTLQAEGYKKELLLTLNLNVSDTATDGLKTISLTSLPTSEDNNISLPTASYLDFSVLSGGVDVVNYKRGFIANDGKNEFVGAADLVHLSWYLAGATTQYPYSPAMHIANDGNNAFVGAADLVHLSWYLAGNPAYPLE